MFNFKNIAFKITLFTVTLISLIIIYFTYFKLIPSQRKAQYKNIYNRALTAVSLSKPLITKSIELKDDLLLLSQIQSIVKLQDVTNAYILDNTGKIFIHNKTSEWDKYYNSPYIKKIISGNDTLVQEISKKGELLFSSRVNNYLTLCIGLSTQRVEQNLETVKKSIKYNLLVVFFVIFLITAIFVKFQITTKFDKFRNILKSVINGNNEKINIKNNNEFGKIAELLNKIIDKTNECIKEKNELVEQEKENSSVVFEIMLNKYVDKPGIFLDADNRISAATKTFKDLKKGSHVFEVTELKPFIEQIKHSLKDPDNFSDISLNNQAIRIIPIHNKTRIGTILIIGNNNT